MMSLLRFLLFILVQLIFSGYIFSNSNILIQGSIESYVSGFDDEARLDYHKLCCDLFTEVDVDINKYGQFRIEIYNEFIQEYTLRYRDNSIVMLVKPGDTVDIKIHEIVDETNSLSNERIYDFQCVNNDFTQMTIEKIKEIEKGIKYMNSLDLEDFESSDVLLLVLEEKIADDNILIDSLLSCIDDDCEVLKEWFKQKVEYRSRNLVVLNLMKKYRSNRIDKDIYDLSMDFVFDSNRFSIKGERVHSLYYFLFLHHLEMYRRLPVSEMLVGLYLEEKYDQRVELIVSSIENSYNVFEATYILSNYFSWELNYEMKSNYLIKSIDTFLKSGISKLIEKDLKEKFIGVIKSLE